MAQWTTVTIEPEDDDRNLTQYLSRAQEAANLNFHKVNTVDGKLVMQFNGGGGTKQSAERAIKKVAEMGDKAAVIAFKDGKHAEPDGGPWAYGDTFRVFKAGHGMVQLNQVKSFDGEPGEGGDDVRTEVYDLFGFMPVKRLE